MPEIIHESLAAIYSSSVYEGKQLGNLKAFNFVVCLWRLGCLNKQTCLYLKWQKLTNI